MGEKGSLKNRIKDFFKIQKKRLKKKNKEIEIKLKKQKQLETEKRKVYSKPRIFLTIFAGYLISSVTYLFTRKPNNTKKNELEKIKILETKIDSVDTLESLETIKQETLFIKNKLISEKKLDFNLNNKTTFLINKIDKKKDEIIKKKDNDSNIIKEELKSTLKVENNDKEREIFKIRNDEVEKEIELVEQLLNKVNSIDHINIINEKITKLEKNSIDDISKNKLKKMKEKIEVLKKQFMVEPILSKDEPKINLSDKKDNYDDKEVIKDNQKISKKVVPTLAIVGGLSAHLIYKVTNEIVDSLKFNNEKSQNEKCNDFVIDKSVTDKEEKVESLDVSDANIKVENNQKNDHYIDKQMKISKQQEKNEMVQNKEIKEERKLDLEKLETFYISVKEIKMAHKVAEQELLSQEQEIDEIKKSLVKLEPVKRKKTLLSIMGSMTKNIFDKAFILSPLAIFKNKLVGGIFSSILLNHRIKKVRRLTTNKNMIVYYNVKDILKQITDKKDAIIKNININSNTISEIELLKSDILKEIDNDLEKYPEIFNIINNLNKLENEINEKNKKLQLELEKVKELEKKGKTKLKKMAA